MKIQLANLGKVAITVEEDPWSINKAYDRLTIVEDNFTSYISRIPVPKGQPISNNRKYWVPFGTRNGSISVNTFTILSDESQLPRTAEENEGPYMIGGVGYFWVGTNGNAVDEMYQTITFQGPAGPTGPQGEPGANGQDGKNGLTPYIGEDGYWWIGETNLNVKAQGPQGTPGTNGKDGKNGTDGKDGANGANGIDGKDGYTPYIGDNGNWWINGKDTGKPSRGPKGETGQPGTTDTSTSMYMDEDNKRVVLVATGSIILTQLVSPPENGRTVQMNSIAPYYDFMVNGYNLNENVLLTANNNFKLRRTTEEISVSSLVLSAEEVNSPEGVIIRVSAPNGLAGQHNATVTVKSAADEFSTRYVNIKYSAAINSQTQGGTQPVPSGTIGDDQTYGQTNN